MSLTEQLRGACQKFTRRIRDGLDPPPPLVDLRLPAINPVMAPMDLVVFSCTVRPSVFSPESLAKFGIRTLSFDQVAQSHEDNHSQWVLEDLAAGVRTRGNHVRVVGKTAADVTLQLCGPFGIHDIPIPPFEVKRREPFFTGIATVEIVCRETGQRLTLQEAQDYIAASGKSPEQALEGLDLVHTSERFLVDSNQTGDKPRIPQTASAKA